MPIWQVPHPRDPEVQPAGLVLECGQAGSRSTVRVGFTLLTLTRGFVGVGGGGGGGGGYEWVGFFRLPRDIIYDRIVCVCAGIALLAIATYMDVDHEGDGRGRTAETTCDRHGPM